MPRHTPLPLGRVSRSSLLQVALGSAVGLQAQAQPAGTPRAVVERLNAELEGILALPEVKAAFETQGMSPAHGSAQDFRRLIARDADRRAAVVKAQGMQAN